MPRFRLMRRKRTYLNCERHRVDFKITVKHINFRMNKAFLANSYYVIFRKENKNKKFQSKNKCLKPDDLKHVAVDEKIKFRACLLQDLQHKYLERYIAKDKRFVLRQVTEVPGEVLYVDCGYFTVPLHVYAMLPSGQALTVELKDPNGMTGGTVELWIEHEPRVLVGNYLPDVWKTIKEFIYPDKGGTPLPPSVLTTNRDKLDFLKKMKLDHHHGPYDVSDDEESEQGDDDTHSESDLGDDPGQFGSFTFGSSAGQEGKSSKSMKAADGSALPRTDSGLDAAMFQLDELPPSPVPTDRAAENISGKEEAEKGEQNHNTSSGALSATETPRSLGEDGGESVSTITVSAKEHPSPRHPLHHLPSARSMSFNAVLPELLEGDAAAEESGAESPSMGRNHVPFHTGTEAVTAAAVVAVAADEQDEAEEVEWLAAPTNANLATTVGAPRTLHRAQSEISGAGTSAPAKPALNPPPRPPVAVAAGASAQGQGHVLHRASSTPGAQLSARALLSMTSEDDRDAVDGPLGSARSGYSGGPVPMRLPQQGPVPRLQPAATTATTAPSAPVVRPPVPTLATGSIPTVRVGGPVNATPSPTLGKKTIKVPVRLSSNSDVNSALASQRSEELQSPARIGYLSPSAADARKELQQQNINVRDLRRNFERPPLYKENSGSTGSQTSRSSEDGNSPRPPTAGDVPVPRLGRANSDRSYSTLSTHDTLPARPAVVPALPLGTAVPHNGKILVPVRLQSTQQEQQGIGYSHRESPRPDGPAVLLSHHQLHRSATAPHLLSPVRLTAPSASGERSAEYRAPHRAEYSQPHVQTGHRRVPGGPTPPPPPPMSGEKGGFSQASEFDRTVRYTEHAHHPPLHRTATAPSLGQSAQDYARSLRAAAYGGSPASTAYRHPSPAAELYHRDRHAPFDHPPPGPSHHSGGHPQRAAPSHIMVPPIRLQSDDLVPEQYERYAPVPGEAPHRPHHHAEVTELHRGEYLREMAYGGQRRGRDVYA